MTTAILYLRVSTDEQREKGYSIPTQREACAKYCEGKGYTVTAEFVEDHSGLVFDRPALTKLKAFLRDHGAEVVVAYTLDRLGRNAGVLWLVEREIVELGARVEFAAGDYADNLAGETHRAADEFVARIEGVIRVERTTRGKRGKAQRGLWVGSGPRPYGYEVDKLAPGGLRVIEAEAEVVRGIFAGFLAGESVRGVAERLTADGVPAYHGEAWGKSTIGRILASRLYAGEATYNRTRRRAGAIVERAPSEWIHFAVPAIVTEATWQAAQRLLRENAKLRRKAPTREYLLSGLIVCRECGHAFGAQTHLAGTNRRASDAPSYRHRTSEGHCSNRQISGRRLEPAVWEAVRGVLTDPESLVAGYKGSVAGQAERERTTRERIASLRDRAAKIEETKARLLAAYADPDLQVTKAEFVAQRERVEGELQDVTRVLGELEAGLSATPDPEAVASFEAFARDVSQALGADDMLALEDKRQVLKLLHCRVVVERDGQALLEGWFGQPVGVLTSSS